MTPEAPDSSDDPRQAQPGGEWFLPQKSRDYLRELFSTLKEPVDLVLFTRDPSTNPYDDFSVKFLKDLARLHRKIRVTFRTLDHPDTAAHAITSFPTILVQPDLYKIRYTGAPAGEEGKSLVETILHISDRDSGLSATSRAMLASLDEDRRILVFVNPSCPYCPLQVVNAFKAAIEKPGRIAAECVEINENPDLADRYSVGSVPHTVINESLSSLGLQPEEAFIHEVATLEPAEKWEQLSQTGAAEVDVIIIGAGPAGLTAGIYAARAGLSAVILEKKTIGGQVTITPVVENYPGFQSVPGVQLMDIMALHARQYVDIHEMEEVLEIKVGKHIEVLTGRGVYLAKAVILSTGATWKKIGVPGEEEFFGHGVSYCATCDGYIYKNKKVVVVGGGNTALTDALYLKNIDADVTLVHRRNEFRAEKYLQDSIVRQGVTICLDTIVTHIEGDKAVQSVRIKDLKTGQTSTLATDAVFVAIGEVSNTGLAEDIGLNLTVDGSIETDRACRTSIPRIYAAGDVTGGIRQIVTAVGQGAIAAASAFEDISRRSG